MWGTSPGPLILGPLPIVNGQPSYQGQGYQNQGYQSYHPGQVHAGPVPGQAVVNPLFRQVDPTYAEVPFPGNAKKSSYMDLVPLDSPLMQLQNRAVQQYNAQGDGAAYVWQPAPIVLQNQMSNRSDEHFWSHDTSGTSNLDTRPANRANSKVNNSLCAYHTCCGSCILGARGQFLCV